MKYKSTNISDFKKTDIDTVSSIVIDGKPIKEYTIAEITTWGEGLGLDQEDIDLYKKLIVFLNK